MAISVIGLTRINNNNKKEVLLSSNSGIVKEDVTKSPVEEKIKTGTNSETSPSFGTVTESVSGKSMDDSGILNINDKELNSNYVAEESFTAAEETILRESGFSIGKLSLDGFSAQQDNQETAPLVDSLFDIDEYLQAFDDLYSMAKGEKSGWSASLFANAVAMKGNSNGEAVLGGISGVPVLSAESLVLNSGYYSLSGTDGNALYSNGSSYYREYLDNHPPLIFSATVSHGIFRKVDISSGLVYSFLSSEYTQYSTFNSYSQKLHYIGIPVSILYDFLPDRSKYSFYTVGGVLFEKAVSAIGSTKVFNGPVLELYEKTSLNTPKIMLSGNMGVGVGYDIINDFGLYLESYLSYYYYTKGQPVSYRTANILSLNMKIGLKYKF